MCSEISLRMLLPRLPKFVCRRQVTAGFLREVSQCAGFSEKLVMQREISHTTIGMDTTITAWFDYNTNANTQP